MAVLKTLKSVHCSIAPQTPVTNFLVFESYTQAMNPQSSPNRGFMKSYLVIPILFCAMAVSSTAMAQQPAPSALSNLQASLTAMVGKATIQDVTLDGTAQVIAGSSDETVPAVFKALSDGSSQTELSLPSGVRNEVRISGAAGQTGTWTTGEGKRHALVQHNLMTDSAWFFPALVVSRMISNTALTVVYVGQEDGLLHFQAYQQQPDAPAHITPTIQHLTQMDLYLNSANLQPAKLEFNIHADTDARVDIPVTIQYSNYEKVNGVEVPFHVQRYVNNCLVMDIQMTTATFNSGLTDSALSAR